MSCTPVQTSDRAISDAARATPHPTHADAKATFSRKGRRGGAKAARLVSNLAALCLAAILAVSNPALALDPDGSSFEQAVVIQADSTERGIAAENDYLRRTYPGWRKTRQALLMRDGRRYDLITIVSPAGETREVFFDITAFFGRF